MRGSPAARGTHLDAALSASWPRRLAGGRGRGAGTRSSLPSSATVPRTGSSRLRDLRPAREQDPGVAGGTAAPRLVAATGWLLSRLAARPARPGRPVAAIMDYGHPGATARPRTSAITSRASRGWRTWSATRRAAARGRQLVDVLTTLWRARARVRARGREVDLEVKRVHRDASMYQPIPEGAWGLCFGWYMHALFGMRHGFRCTATCGRSSSRSTATSATCSPPKPSST